MLAPRCMAGIAAFVLCSGTSAGAAPPADTPVAPHPPTVVLSVAFSPPVALAGAPLDAPGDSLYALAGELYSTERYVEAIPVFEQLLSINPRFANAYALLGSAFLHLGVYEKAIANFERALGLDEGIKLAYLGLVTAYYYTADLEGARKWARKCLPVLSPSEKGRWTAFFERKFPELDVG